MNLCEQGIAGYLGEERLAYLQTITVGIAGAGGLGSNCAMHLVRSGFKRFVLADYDKVEATNLNRQHFRLDQVGKLKIEALVENMRAVNPDLLIDYQSIRLTRDNLVAVFHDCDVVVEALDGPLYKKAVVEVFLPTDKLVVSASGIGGSGETDSLLTRKVRDNFYMIGDMETACSVKHPPMSPKVGVAAAKQADVVLHHYLEKFKTEGGA